MSTCDYCGGNPTFGPRGERCPICGAAFGDAPGAVPPTEVYREEKPGAYLPAKGTGTPCYHVYAGGTWYELYDFTGEGAVTVVPYGPTANREALGRRCGLFELPARIAAQVGEIERRARVCAADPCPGCDGCPPEGAP